MAQPGRSFLSSTYRFGFNGKENEQGWGNQTTQDYGFRFYNANIARFLSVDPLTGEYPELTPYQFASNTPIQAIDLDGLEPKSVVKEKYQTTSTWVLPPSGDDPSGTEEI